MLFGLKRVAAILAVFGLLVSLQALAYYHWVLDGQSDQEWASQGLVRPIEKGCATALAGGTTSELRPTPERVSTGYGDYAVRNDLDRSVVALLGDDRLTVFYQAIVVLPHQVTSIRFPEGHYGLAILAGTRWCDLKRGFFNGSRFSINGGVTITPAAPGLSTLTAGHTPEDFRVAFAHFDSSSLVPQYTSRMGQRGFRAEGSVNARPLSFMIDTGAAITTLPSAIASSVGIGCQATTMFDTANGRTRGCLGTASELQFGPFVLRDVQVAILDNVVDALLGVNVLRLFRTEFRPPVLLITLPAGAGGHQTGFVPGQMSVAPTVPWGREATLWERSLSYLAAVRRADRVPLLLASLLTFIATVTVFTHSLMRRRVLSSVPARAAPRSHYYDPKQFRGTRVRVQPVSPDTADPLDALLAACWGDGAMMERLIRFEISSSWNLGRKEAARRALARLRRDRQ